jgi:hypothetical protein
VTIPAVQTTAQIWAVVATGDDDPDLTVLFKEDRDSYEIENAMGSVQSSLEA